jgi:hypothetical protein
VSQSTTHKLVRQFDIQAHPHQFMWLASQPALAPHYLNFLTDIRQSEPKQHSQLAYEKSNWRRFKVCVQYRTVLKISDFVYLLVDQEHNKVFLDHDGGLAQFEAVFCVALRQVTLTCSYRAKVPLVSWLIAKVLDRALRQVASAMDRYAATLSVAPT